MPEPKDTDILVRVDAISLNYRDLLVCRGAYHKGTPPAGVTPCSDAAGRVVAIGANVTSLRVGDTVMSMFAPDWLGGSLDRRALKTTLGSGSGPGVLAEFVALPERAFIRVPDGWSGIQAATLPCAGLTAWHALFEEAPVDSRSSVLVIGAGGVSVFALQMAHACGARVLAISSSDERLGRLRTLGAAAGVNYRQTPGWGDAVRTLSGGEGVDLVLEVGGAGTFDESCRAVRPGGTVALIGTLAGPAAVNLTPALLRNIRIQGTTVGSREMCERMNRALATWRLEPVVDDVYSFDEAPKAFHRLASGGHFGKVVIQVS
jgi:NADPH:quinone reductase-like Zn-dependent oxidoreductase